MFTQYIRYIKIRIYGILILKWKISANVNLSTNKISIISDDLKKLINSVIKKITQMVMVRKGRWVGLSLPICKGWWVYDSINMFRCTHFLQMKNKSL